MKKKFVLTLALVLMVAVTLTAAPIELKGSFYFGYGIDFKNSKVSTDAAKEVKLGKLSVAGDFWKVSLGDTPLFENKRSIPATLDIFLDKALAEQGVDMGDLTVKLSLGNMGVAAGLNVYNDANSTMGDNSYGVRMNGTSNGTAAVEIGYGSLVTAKVTFDPTDKTNKPFGISAKTTPVDGVSASVAYTNYGDDKFGTAVADKKGTIGGAVTVDVAELADLDFGLKASVFDAYFLEKETNYLLANVAGSYEDIAAYVEYQLFDKTSNIVTKVSYSGVENLGVYAKLTLADLSDINTKIGAGASYVFGGVEYALDLGYDVKAETFSFTPSVFVSF